MSDEFDERAREMATGDAPATQDEAIAIFASALRETARAARIAELEWAVRCVCPSDARRIDARLAELKRGTP